MLQSLKAVSTGEDPVFQNWLHYLSEFLSGVMDERAPLSARYGYLDPKDQKYSQRESQAMLNDL